MVQIPLVVRKEFQVVLDRVYKISFKLTKKIAFKVTILVVVLNKYFWMRVPRSCLATTPMVGPTPTLSESGSRHSDMNFGTPGLNNKIH